MFRAAFFALILIPSVLSAQSVKYVLGSNSIVLPVFFNETNKGTIISGLGLQSWATNTNTPLFVSTNGVVTETNTITFHNVTVGVGASPLLINGALGRIDLVNAQGRTNMVSIFPGNITILKKWAGTNLSVSLGETNGLYFGLNSAISSTRTNLGLGANNGELKGILGLGNSNQAEFAGLFLEDTDTGETAELSPSGLYFSDAAASAQTRTNLGLGASWLTNTSLAITNVTGLQPALDGKLATNGTAASAVMLTNSSVEESLVITDDGGRLEYYASQSDDPSMGIIAPNGAYSLMGVRGTNSFYQTSSDVARFEKQGGQLATFLGKELILQGGTINAPDATSTAATNVANVGTLDNRYAAKPVRAVFNIPLGGNYTDFELKATVANFATNSTYPLGMVYFYHSPDPGKSVVTEQMWSTQPEVFFTDSQYVNPTNAPMNQRAWRKQSASQSIAAMRASPSTSVIAGVVVSVMPSGPESAQITSTNPALVWSYCRMTSTGYEEDAGGHSIWYPVQPIWTSQGITP